jgi:hypothetical protein
VAGVACVAVLAWWLGWQFISPERYDGYLYNYAVDQSIKPSHAQNGKDITECREKCILRTGCVVAEYSRSFTKCYLYEKQVTTHPNTFYDIWVRK